MKNSIPIAFLLIFAGACSKEVAINLPSVAPVPVMNVVAVKDSIIYMDLSWSSPVYKNWGTSFASIEDAKVSLYVNGSLEEVLYEKEINYTKYYCSLYKAKAGDNLKLEAVVKPIYGGNEKTVSGETKVPVSPVITGGSAIKLGTDGYSRTSYRFNFDVAEPATEDFYQLKIFMVKEGVIDRGIALPFSIENIKTEDGGIFDVFTEEEQHTVKYFDDKSFNGKTFNLKIRTDAYVGADEVAFELSAISKDTYLYFKTLQLQSLRNEDPLYEKVKIHSNIRNGWGIMGVVSPALLYAEVK